MNRKGHNEIVLLAQQKASDVFNSLPYETRKRLANGSERLSEINLLLSNGDNLSLAHIKARKRQLENWLLDWYKEQKEE